jgi:hypothetical protein
MEGCQYRRELSEPVISIASANFGDMQKVLIQQQTPSIYQELMTATGGGLNQVATGSRIETQTEIIPGRVSHPT